MPNLAYELPRKLLSTRCGEALGATCRASHRLLPREPDRKSANLTSISYPNLYPNIIRLRPTRIDEHRPEIPVCQGIIRRDPTPGPH